MVKSKYSSHKIEKYVKPEAEYINEVTRSRLYWRPDPPLVCNKA